MDTLTPWPNVPRPHPDEEPPFSSPQDSPISSSSGVRTRHPKPPHLILPPRPSPAQFSTPAPQFSAVPDLPRAPQSNTSTGHSPVPHSKTSPGLPPAPQFKTPHGHSTVPLSQSNTSPGLHPAGHSLVPRSITSHVLHPAHHISTSTHISPQFNASGSSPASQFNTPTSLSVSPDFSTPPNLSPLPKFKTPLGPPVFSSPHWSSAVPVWTPPASPQPVMFQTPPASPQPVMFSSSTPPLPASPLQLHTNGSADSVDANKSTLDAVSPYVLFSAHKVLKQKKLANILSLGFGALISPGREITPGLHKVQSRPHHCRNCGAYSNLYCSIILASGRWQCVICKNLNESEEDYVAAHGEDLKNRPELSFPVVNYIQGGSRIPGIMPVSNSRIPTSIILVIDECLDEVHFQHLQSSLHAFVDSLSPITRIGIISYGRTVSVYDFSHGAKASADVLPGNRSPTPESMKPLINGRGVYMSPIHASLAVAHEIFSSMRAYKLNVPEPSRERCIGTAVEVALALIQGPSAEMPHGVIKRRGSNFRILVCAGGPNTFGPGSVPHSVDHLNYPYMEKMAMNYMEHIGFEACCRNTVVDILCAGTCPVRVPVLQPLAKASGGVLVIHDDFGEAFGMNLQRASTRAAGCQGMFKIHCSDDIHVTRVVGPGKEAHADAHEAFKNDTTTCIQMLCVEESQSFALSMEVDNDIKNDHVFFQFVVQLSNFQQANISRVITVKLPTVDNVLSYLASVHDEVAAVLIAKRTVLQAKTPLDAVDMQLTIDERVKDIASRFGHKLPESKFCQFPRELSLLPEYLFHLRRGPLLGGIVGHEDERSVLRNFFLNASFDLSLRMVVPHCLMYHDGGTFEELPALDTAVQSDVAVILDHGTDVFIWLGSELLTQEGRSAAALAACKTLAEEFTQHRFPAPRILTCKEGSSQARYFISRLIPAHKDPPYVQEARFPQLRNLTAEKRAKLKSSFISFDEFSYCEWMRSLKLVPPEPT